MKRPLWHWLLLAFFVGLVVAVYGRPRTTAFLPDGKGVLREYPVSSETGLPTGPPLDGKGDGQR